MHLVSTLCAGVMGAANGWAELYVRGTSTRATWYPDFEASTSNSSGANITLDAYGAVEVYVNQLVDVIVKSSDGTTIRSFTDGYASPNIEVISPSFTGTDYVSAATGVNKPTTLQAVLDLWSTNAGAPDWKVDLGGVDTSLDDAFGALTGLVFNVKSPAYGAVGDGVTNDQSAILAALAAAVAAGGGIVFFPRGTYLISTSIEWDHRVSMVGVGAGGSTLKTGSNSNARILTLTTGTSRNTPILFYGMSFDATQTNTGEQFYSSVAINVRFAGCEFGASSTCTGNLVRNFDGGGKMTFQDCKFTAYSGYAAYLASDVEFVGCKFASGISTYNQELVRADTITALLNNHYSFEGCIFDASGVSAAPSDLRGVRVVSGTAHLSMIGCHFVSTGQLFTTGIMFISGCVGSVRGCTFSGATNRYESVSSSSPIASGSSLDMTARSRQTGAGAAFTLPNCVAECEIRSTGTVPTITMPAKLVPGQHLRLLLLNASGGLWGSNVTFSGATTYGSVATNAPDGTLVIAEFVLSDVDSSGTYVWVGTSIKMGSA